MGGFAPPLRPRQIASRPLVAALYFSYDAGLRTRTCKQFSSGETRIMPKQKTHKGTKKRFRLSATGKAMHRKAGTSHLASRMTQKRKRQLRGTAASATVESKMVVKALAGNSY
jgi:large subunit ribosomal protein L35